MSRDDQKTDELFDRLAGKTTRPEHVNDSEAKSNTGAAVLRDAICAQIDTQRVAEQANNDDLSVEQKAQMDAIKQQLLAQGLIGVASSSDSCSTSKSNWLGRLQQLIFATGWERPVALAMSMVFVITIGVQVGLSPSFEPDVIVRGGVTPEIISSDATKYSQALAKSLRELGAKVLIVKINADDLTMRVDVPKAVDLSTIKKLFEDNDIKLEGYPPYRLIVKQAR